MNEPKYNLDIQTDRVGFLKRLYSHKLLCSILICVLTGFLVSLVTGFRFEYYTNDDYQLSFLLIKGETHNLYVNNLLSMFLSQIQQALTAINCFVVFQFICCCLSMVIIVYVFFSKSKSIWSIFIAILVCGFVFASDVLIVQYSQTPIVICVSGFLLAYYATFFECRKKIQITQLVISILLIVLASLFRFTPFLVGLAISFIFIISKLFLCFFDDNNSHIKERIFYSFKKCFSLFLVFLISFSISFGADILSNVINSSSSSYSDFVEYNNARMRVADYETVPYQGNESFYNSVGIHSQAELSMFGYDKESYNADTLNKIADYSEKIVQDGDSKPVFAIKKTVKRVIRSLKDIYSSLLSVKESLHLPIGNKFFLLIVAVLLLGIAILFIFLVYKRKTRLGKEKTPKHNYILNTIIILTWLLFFLITKINDNNFLFLPLFIIVIVAMVFDKVKNYVAYILFTIAPMALYLYQYNFRISYRVSFTFLFPAILYMICLTDFPKVKVNRRSIVKIVLYSMLLVSFIIPSIWCLNRFYPQCTLNYNMSLRDYINNHSENIFIVGTQTNACVDEGYYNALFVPNIPDNEVLIAWTNSSDFFINDLKKKNINDILLDSINSNIRIVIEENGTNDLIEQKKNYEDFYNVHYFNGNNTVKLELDKQFNYNIYCENPERSIKKVGVYKVVK